MAVRTLGLDIGTNSVGWAVIDVPERNGEDGAVIAMGSRVFPAGAEVSGSALTTSGAKRRQARLMRRQIRRRAGRRAAIRRELARIGMLPVDDQAFESLMALDPAELLARSESGAALTLREIGRVVYWFSSRRGFLSLRAGGSTVIDDDDGEPTDVARFRLSQFSASTGERLVVGQEDRLIDFLETQAQQHPELLTRTVLFGRRGRLSYPVRPIPRSEFLSGPEATWLEEFGLHGLVFYQRAVFWTRTSIGLCSIADPKLGQQRAARAERAAQQFRIHRIAMDLRVGEDMRPLEPDERDKVVAKLATQRSMSFGALRKLLHLSEHEPVNFDDGAKKHLIGNETDAALAQALGVRWVELNEHERDEVVYVLVGGGTADEQRRQLVRRFGCTPEQARAATEARLPSGRASFSRQTLRTLLPRLQDAGNEREAIIAAGFRTPEQARADRPVSAEEVSNPLVRAALVQVVKVVEAVAKEHGRPGDGPAFDVVRIELARDVRAKASDRAEINKEQRKRELQRRQFADQIAEFAPGSADSRDAQRRVRLWAEQNQRCLYTGSMLTLQAVLDGTKTQIDHILPRSRTLNNSDGNVALVLASANQAKGDRTVFEWGGPDKVAEVAARARDLGLGRTKIRNIEREEVPTDAIPDSLLITTGYVNALARDLVRQVTGSKVEVSRGRLTGELRYMTGLTKDPNDHRRHALDAAMVALTTPAIANRLARRYKTRIESGRADRDHGLFEPWAGARNHILAAYDAVLTSHKPRRKVSGQLVEDTLYGRIGDPAEHRWARRRSLAAGLTQAQFDQIADPVIKERLLADLVRRGVNHSTGTLKFDPANPPTMRDGTPIRSVRCHMRLPSNTVLRADQPKSSSTPAGNQVAGIFRNEAGKFRIVVVGRLDAQRDRTKPPRTWFAGQQAAGETLLCTVASGETLRCSSDAEARYVVVVGLEGSSDRLLVRQVNDSSGQRPEQLSAARLARLKEFEKVVITPSGLVRRARD